MPGSPRPYDHVVRVVAIFALGVLVFLAARSWLVPPDFGKYGFYRASALDDIKALPVKFAGHQTCEVCHAAIVEARGQTKHAQLSCEVCHGPQLVHATNLQPLPAKIDTPQTLCLRCHRKIAGKPATFPQVSADNHPIDADCTMCHNPHSPEIKTDAGKAGKEPDDEF
jgi:hypothetical protein